MKRQLIHGDSVKELKKFDDNSVDLLCTDPPYGYGFMGRDWDKVLPDINIFKECFRVLKPGSMAFVMSAPRSDVQYRMAEMLEKVGFKIDYTPIYWTYATGFPKAMNIGKMIDKRGGQDLSWFIDYVLEVAKKKNITKKELTMLFPSKNGKPTGWLWNKQKTQGITLEQYNKIKDFLKLPFDTIEEAEREVVGKKSSGLGSGKTYAFTDDNDKSKGEVDITIPKTEKAKELDGSYGGFQPKPAVEVVIVAMKPLDKKGYLEQAQDNGKGITWFDDCRIPFEEGYVEPENQTMPDLRDVGRKSKEAIGIDKLSYGQVQNAKRKPYKSDYQKYVEKQKSFKNAKTIGTTIKGNEHFLGGDIKQLNPATNYQKKDGNETRGWNNSSGYGRDSKPKTTKRKPREDGTVFKTSGFKSENNDTAEASPMGRFPANLLVSDKVLDDGKIRKASDTKRNRSTVGMLGMPNDETPEYNDSGGYSRYFSLDSWFQKNIKQLPEPVQKTFPFMIVPKASKSEKNDGLDNFDTKQTTGGGGGVGDYIDDVNSASGKFGCEKAPSRNIHPTVKPLTLMNYLVVLGSRKGDVVLEPFAGSGTTALACVSQERDYIAIEREEEYYKIAKARLDKVERPLKMWEKFSG